MVVRALVPVRLISLGFVALAVAAGVAMPNVASARTVVVQQTPPQATKPAPATSKLDVLVGTWDGVAQTPNGDLPVRMILTVQDGKGTGTIESQMGSIGITGVTLNGDEVLLGIDMQGAAGTINAKISGDTIEGTWALGADSGPFGVKKVPPAGASTDAAAADPVSGEWQGTAERGGRSVPITLVLKLAGEIVTGEISSAEGKATLTASAWKDATLLLTYQSPAGGPVSMGGQIVDGKVSGVTSYNNGEVKGTWTAVKKK